jgi:hypothetical protein
MNYLAEGKDTRRSADLAVFRSLSNESAVFCCGAGLFSRSFKQDAATFDAFRTVFRSPGGQKFDVTANILVEALSKGEVKQYKKCD